MTEMVTYKVLWHGYSAIFSINPGIVENAQHGCLSDQMHIIMRFKNRAKVPKFLHFNELKIIKMRPMEKVDPIEAQDRLNRLESSRIHHEAMASRKKTHCDQDYCTYCEFGRYDECPNNR